MAYHNLLGHYCLITKQSSNEHETFFGMLAYIQLLSVVDLPIFCTGNPIMNLRRSIFERSGYADSTTAQYPTTPGSCTYRVEQRESANFKSSCSKGDSI